MKFEWTYRQKSHLDKFYYLVGRKFRRAKLSPGETIRRVKFSPPDKKFVTFTRRKLSPNKSKSVLKWSTSESTSNLSHLDKVWLYWWVKLCRAKLFVGQNFRNFSKNSSLPPDKVLPDKVISSLSFHASTDENLHDTFQMARSAGNFSIFYIKFGEIKFQMAQSAENCSMFSIRLCKKR